MENDNREQYVKFFDDADNDNDGFLSFDEFRKAIVRDNFKGSELDVLRMFRLADANRDNKLSLREFLFSVGYYPDDDDIEREKIKGLGRHAKNDYERMLQIRRTFELYDKHGLLGKDDVRKALKDLGHETKAEEALKWAKLNDKDGLLYDEYLKVIYWLDDKQRNEVKHKA